ncbi:uncharacterized protein LOC143582182 [Bidens hawaiensis]|uniref:uncharacterized protein LOC143582182 n=1 Tax=Bidens hawaiensis TaxID=980011 RepID=UPI00404AEAAB
MEKYREKKSKLAYGVYWPRKGLRQCVTTSAFGSAWKGRGVPRKYIDIIMDMYDRSATSFHAPAGDTDFFSVEVGLHQGSELSQFLFAVVLDELSKVDSGNATMVHDVANDIVLVSERKQDIKHEARGVVNNLREKKVLKINRSKMEYLHCDFGGVK